MASPSKRVVLVGHCSADTSFLRTALARADRATHVQSAEDQPSLERLLSQGVDLVLVNRLLQWGFDQPSGVELIRQMKQSYPHARLMLISNYPDAQAAAQAAGAVHGIGKSQLGSEQAVQVLRLALSGPAVDEPA
jgi:DNA-binding NarL/FixJ family response regulator